MKISVRVIPNAKKSEVIKEQQPDCFKVKVNQVAEDGKANEAVIKAFAEYFKIKKSSIQIISGEKSPNKILEIFD